MENKNRYAFASCRGRRNRGKHRHTGWIRQELKQTTGRRTAKGKSPVNTAMTFELGKRCRVEKMKQTNGTEPSIEYKEKQMNQTMYPIHRGTSERKRVIRVTLNPVFCASNRRSNCESLNPIFCRPRGHLQLGRGLRASASDHDLHAVCAS